MPFVVDVPGQGAVDFGDEDTAKAYFQKNATATPQATPSTAPTTVSKPPAYEYEKSGIGPDVVNFLREFSNAASAGLSEKAGAGLSAIGVKNAELTGVAPEGQIGSLGEEFKDALSHQSGSLEGYEKSNPKLAFLAKMLGLVSPGGVYSGAMKGASEMSIVAKLLGNGKILPRLAGAFLRGGTANAIYGLGTESLNPDTDVSKIPGDVAKDFAIGGALDAGTTGAIEGVKAIPSVVRNLFSGAKQTALNATEHLPLGVGQTVKDARLNSFSNDMGNIASSNEAADSGAAGNAVSTKLGEIKEGVLKNYGNLTNEVLGKFGDQPVSAEQLRKGIMEQLGGMGAVDSNGRVIEDSLISSFDPELKPVVQRLASFSDELAKNPTLADMDRITKAMGKLAKFGSSNRGPRELIFGSLFNDARTAFLNGIDDVVAKSGESAPGYRAATRAADAAVEESTKAQAGASAASKSKKMFPQLFMGGDVEGTKAGAEAAASRVGDSQAVVDSLDAQNAMKGAAQRDAITAARKNVAANLNVFEGPIGKLADQLPEEVVSKAASTGKLHLGSVVDEAIAANPAYKAPMKQAVVSDIVRRADNPKNLAKALDLYKDVLPKLMEKAEISELFKLAGKSNAEAGAFQKGFTSLMSKLQGVSTEMGPAALAPRTVAPWLNLIQQRAKSKKRQSMAQPPVPPAELPS